MRIDDRVEPLVRAALRAAVGRDDDAFAAAMEPFSDDVVGKVGLELTVAIASFTLRDRYDGKPSLDQLAALADAVCDRERWAGLMADEVAGFLASVSEGQPLAAASSPVDALVVPFLVTASLLASRAEAAGAGEWSGQLDEVEAAMARDQR